MAAAAEPELPPALHPSYTHSHHSDSDFAYAQDPQRAQEQNEEEVHQQHQPRKWLWSDEVDDEDENQDWVERLHIEEQKELWARQSQQQQQQLQQEAQLKEQLQEQERERQAIADQELERQQRAHQSQQHQQQQSAIMSWRATPTTTEPERLKSFRQRTMENNAGETWQTDLNLRYQQDIDDGQMPGEDEGDALASQYQLMEELGSEYTCDILLTSLLAVPSSVILPCTQTNHFLSFLSI